jgi:hypothetical protein
MTFDLLISFRPTVARDSLSDYNDYRCYADAPLSGRLCLQARLVRKFFACPFPLLSGRCHFREHQNLHVSKLVFERTKQTDTTPTTLNGVELSVHTAFEQYPAIRKSGDYSPDMSTIEKGFPSGTTNDDGSSPIISTSDDMPHIVGDSSKLDYSQASTHPLPTVSPSPRTQSV